MSLSYGELLRHNKHYPVESPTTGENRIIIKIIIVIIIIIASSNCHFKSPSQVRQRRSSTRSNRKHAMAPLAAAIRSMCSGVEAE